MKENKFSTEEGNGKRRRNSESQREFKPKRVYSTTTFKKTDGKSSEGGYKKRSDSKEFGSSDGYKKKSYSDDKFPKTDGFKKKSYSKDGYDNKSEFKKKSSYSDYKESGDGFKKKSYSNDKFGSESGFKKKSFSSDKFESGDGYKKKSYSKDGVGGESGYKKKPYSSDRFDSGDGFKKKSYSNDKFGGESGFKKKSFSSDRYDSGDGFKKKSYSNDKFGGESGFKKKSYSSDKFESGDGFKKKSYSNDKFGGESGYKKKSYSSDKFESGDGFKKRSFGSDKSGSEGGFQKRDYSKSGGFDKFAKKSFSNASDERYKRDDNRKDSEYKGFEKKNYKSDDSSYEKRTFSKKKPVANTTPEYYNENEANPHKTFDNEKRLNQYIASTGLCSRREADVYIETGCITVNGELVTTHGTKVSSADEVRFNGEPLESKHKVYILLNKPKDYVTTTEDPQNRKTVYELVKNATKERVFSVGRLDRMTTGVLLFTNDGELTNNLMHPKYNKKKIYQLELDIPLTAAHFSAITDGINLEDGFVQPDALSYVSPDSKKVVGIEIHSGKNRIVRRIFEHFGYTIKKLDRVYFAGLTKKNLSRGEWRHLTEKEVGMLKRGAFE